jgi:hypothetical protein
MEFTNATLTATFSRRVAWYTAEPSSEALDILDSNPLDPDSIERTTILPVTLSGRFVCGTH